MELEIIPVKQLNGEISAPSSKSYSHRAFIAASLAKGVSKIKNPLVKGDVGVTIDILRELKVKILAQGDGSYLVEGTGGQFKPVYKILNCKNSGTSLRMFTTLSLLIEGGLNFTGEFLKRNRPITPLLDALKGLGGEYKLSKDKLQVARRQKACNPVQIPGDISSQFITALLFTCPLLTCNNSNHHEITLTTPLISSPYIKISIEVLNSFGINVMDNLGEDNIGSYKIACGQNYRPQVYTIPGDFSSAAFMIAAAVLTQEESKVIINNLDFKSPQGDKQLIDILKIMGADITVDTASKMIGINGGLTKYPLEGIEIDCHEIPDLFPILSVIGAFAKGKTVLFNASHIRGKESDRIGSMKRELEKMGVKTEEHEDKLIIHHCEQLKGSLIEHENDHRIAMACVIAAINSSSQSTIKDIEIIEDSYPSFIEDLKKLGVKL